MRSNPERKTGYMHKTFFKSLVDEIAKFPEVQLGLGFGGEATLHPDFQECLAYCLTKPFRQIRQSTNGVNINGKFDVALSDSRVHLNISLHNPTKQVKKSIYELAINPKREMRLSVSFIESERENLEREINYYRGLVDQVNLAPLMQGVSSMKSSRKLDYSGKLCKQVLHSLYILWNGGIVLCCHDICGFNADENIKDYEGGIKQLWLTRFRQYHRQSLLYGTPQKPLCKTCVFWRIRNHIKHFQVVNMALNTLTNYTT